jgi:transposase
MTSKGGDKMNQTVVGVDISKDHLDVHRLSDGQDKRFANDARGRRALITWANGGRVAFEPSGACHRGLEQALAKAKLSAIKINPLASTPLRRGKWQPR